MMIGKYNEPKFLQPGSLGDNFLTDLKGLCHIYVLHEITELIIIFKNFSDICQTIGKNDRLLKITHFFILYLL